MASLLICTPCYGKVLGEGYLHSIMETVDLLRTHGHKVKVKTLGNESLITRARNNMVAHFLSSDFEKMMFIDADITWPAHAVLELLESDKQVCGIPYPTKRVDWDRVAKFVNRPHEDAIKPGQLRLSSLIFTINRTEESAAPVDGWIEVNALATGFLMMERAVLEQMRDHYREALSYKNDVAGYAKFAPPEHCVGIFECLIDPDTRRYLSEDYAFCRRWRDLGGKIYCRTEHRLIHSGSMDF